MASPIFHGSKPKLYLTFSPFGAKKVSDADVTLKLELYVGRYDASKCITLTKSDLTPVSGKDGEYVVVINSSTLASGANISSRLTVSYTDPDTGKAVEEIRVQDQGIKVNTL